MTVELNTALQQLPGQGWGLIALLTVGGVVLWAAGRRFLKTGFALAGLITGVLAGYVAARWMELSPEAASVPALVAGAVAAGLALLAYRVAVAGGLAAVLAVSLPVALWTVATASSGPGEGSTSMGVLASTEPEQGPPEPSSSLDELDEWLDSLRSDDETDGDEGEEGPPLSAMAEIPLQSMRESLAEDIDEAKASMPPVVRRAIDSGVEAWNELSETWQQRLLGAAVLGAAGGFVLGLLAASLSASLVTAGGGAMAWMSGVWAASARLGFEGGDWLPSTPMVWLLIWIVIAVIGLAIQWTIRPRRADNPA